MGSFSTEYGLSLDVPALFLGVVLVLVSSSSDIKHIVGDFVVCSWGDKPPIFLTHKMQLKAMEAENTELKRELEKRDDDKRKEDENIKVREVLIE